MFSFSIAAPAIPLSLFLQRSPLGFLVGIKHSLTNFRLPSSVAKINRCKSAASWSLIAFLALLQSCLKFGLSSKKLKICEHYQVFFGKVPDFLQFMTPLSLNPNSCSGIGSLAKIVLIKGDIVFVSRLLYTKIYQ